MLSREQIKAILLLYVAEKSNKEMSGQTRVALRSVQKWIQKCRAKVMENLSLQVKKTGPTKKAFEGASVTGGCSIYIHGKGVEEEPAPPATSVCKNQLMSHLGQPWLLNIRHHDVNPF